MKSPAATSLDLDVVRRLQSKIHGMQASIPRTPLATHPALGGLVSLRTGGAYEVDSATLALALLAPASAEGAWTAVVGARDFGVEAAAEMGIDLTRTVLVPDPGEHWLEVTAALIDVVTMVALKPPPRVTEHTVGRLSARLRKHSCALIAWGAWPGAEARLGIESSTWSGAGHGHGRLVSRRLIVSVTRGSAPARRTDLVVTETGLQGPYAEQHGAEQHGAEHSAARLAVAEVG